MRASALCLTMSWAGLPRLAKNAAFPCTTGAGKTTLLNVLTGRHPSYTGSVLVNGRPTSSSELRTLSVCVMQDDVLLRTFSARECLLFSARLRLPRSMSTEAKVARVQHLIVQLGLEKCADTAVLELSGGERKRTAIGVELVTDPRLFFLDEPTSGLDSATALSVMQIVTRLAREEGRTVITTIHQPSSETFALFERLLLLADGRTAYDGPAQEAVQYFGELGFRCPVYSNPADYFIKLLSRDEDPAYRDRVARVVDHFARNEGKGVGKGIAAVLALPASSVVAKGGNSRVEAGAINADDEVHAGASSGHDLARPRATPSQTGAGFVEEFGQLFIRAVKTFVREPMTLRVRLLQSAVMGAIIALFFYDLGYDLVGAKDRSGALFFVLSGQILPVSFPIVLTCTCTAPEGLGTRRAHGSCGPPTLTLAPTTLPSSRNHGSPP